MKIGNIEIQNKVVIAPMAGITNPAFRQICKQFKPGLIYTEMVSDKAICYENKKTLGMTEVLEALSHEEAAELLHKNLKSGDTILFKASRGMKLEKIIDLL